MGQNDPIYKTKDGQTVTKSQLINSGYTEERINKGLQGGILTLSGDTQTPSQSFVTKDGQLVTHEQLLKSGYSQERIDKGISSGILQPKTDNKTDIGKTLSIGAEAAVHPFVAQMKNNVPVKTDESVEPPGMSGFDFNDLSAPAVKKEIPSQPKVEPPPLHTESIFSSPKYDMGTGLHPVKKVPPLSDETILGAHKETPKEKADRQKIEDQRIQVYTVDPNDPLKTYFSFLDDKKKEIIGQQIKIESTGQNKINKNAASRDVNNINDVKGLIKERMFPTIESADLWIKQHPPTDEPNETTKIANEIMIDDKIAKMALKDNDGDITKAAIQYYRAKDDQTGSELKIWKIEGVNPPPELEAQLVGNFIRNNRTMRNLASTSQEWHNKVKEVESTFYDKYPSVHNQKILSDIAAAREKYGYNNWFANFPGVNSSDEIAVRLVQEGKWTQDDLKFYNNFSRYMVTDLPTPGVVESIAKTAGNIVEGIPRGAYNLLGRDLLHSQGDILSQDISEEMNKITEPNFSGVHFVSHATGNLLGVVLPMTAEAKILDAFNLVKSIDKAHEVALGMTFYNDIVTQERQNNLGNPILAHLSALIQSGIWMKWSKAYPALAKQIAGESAPEINAVLTRLSTNEISNAAAIDAINRTISGKAQKIISSGGRVIGGSIKAAADVTATVATNEAVAGIISGHYDLDHAIHNAASTFKNMVFGTPMLGIAKEAGTRNVVKEQIDRAAKDPMAHLAEISKLAETNPEFAKIAPQLIKNLISTVKNSSLLSDAGLSDAQRKTFQLHAVNEQALTQHKEDLMSKAADMDNEALRNKAKGEIDKVQSQIDESKKIQDSILKFEKFPDPDKLPQESKEKPIFSDFDDTIADKSGNLLPHGEDIKKRIAAGEDVTIVTHSKDEEGQPEGTNRARILKALGLESQPDNLMIYEGLEPADKARLAKEGGGILVDNSKENLDAAKEAGVETKDANEINKPLSPDQQLFNQIKEKADEGYKTTLQAAEDKGNIEKGLEYMQDKFSENPVKFRKDFGDEITDKVLERTPTEKLKKNIDYLIENVPDDPSIPVLDKLIEKRESAASTTNTEEVGDGEKIEMPSDEQQLKDVQEGKMVTFTYKNESEVPDVFKDKISSKGEVNGEPVIRVTVAQSLADYELSKQKLPESSTPSPTVREGEQRKGPAVVMPGEVKKVQDTPIVPLKKAEETGAEGEGDKGGEPPAGEEKPTANGDKPISIPISKGGMKNLFGHEWEKLTRDDQLVFSEAMKTVKSRAEKNGLSLESQLATEVDDMRGIPGGPEPTEHNIIVAGSRLMDIHNQLNDAIAQHNEPLVDLLSVQRQQVADLIRVMSNKAGRNLRLFSLVFSKADDGERTVVQNRIKSILKVNKMFDNVADLDKSDLTADQKDLVRPFVEELEQIKKDRDGYVDAYGNKVMGWKEELETALKKNDEADLQQKIKEAYEKGKREATGTGGTKKAKERKSQQLRDLANKLRQSDELDKFLKGPGGQDVQKMGVGGTYKEILASVLEDVAAVMDKVADIAKYIKDAVDKITGVDKGNLLSDVNTILARTTLKMSKDEALEKIRKMAEVVPGMTKGSTVITEEMVNQGLVRAVVMDHIMSEVPSEKVIDEAYNDLKQVLPDISRENVADAFARRNQFALPTKQNLQNLIKEKVSEAKAINIKQIRIRALEAADQYHLATDAKEKARIKGEFEKGLDERIKQLQDAKKEPPKSAEEKSAEKDKERIDKINEEIEFVNKEKKVFQQAIGNKKEASKDLVAARQALDEAYTKAGIRKESQERQPIRIEREYQAAVEKAKSELSGKELDDRLKALKDQRNEDLKVTHTGVLALVNDAMEDFINDNKERFDDPVIKKVADIRKIIDLSGENLADQKDKVYQALSELIKDKDISNGDRMQFEQIRQDFENNNQITADKLAEQRIQKQYERDIRNNERKLNSGLFTEIPTTAYDFRRSELLQTMERDRKNSSQRLSKLVDQAKGKTRTLSDKIARLSTKILVSGFPTVMKVAEAATLKPLIDSLVESTFGKLAGKITDAPHTTIDAVREGFATWGRFKTEAAKLAHIEKMSVEKQKALDNLKAAKESGDKKALKKAEEEFKIADMKNGIAALYHSIDANTLNTFKEYLVSNSTDYDENIGKGIKDDIKNYRSGMAKLGYVLDGWIRLHGALKAGVSARPEVMRSYVSTLQYMVKQGRELTPENLALAQTIAAMDYEYGRLTNPTFLSQAITKWKYNARSPVARGFGHFLFPVSTIAINIAKRGLDYSTLGAEGWIKLGKGIKEGIKLNKVEGKEYDTWMERVKEGMSRMPLRQRKYIASVIGRGMAGAALWGLSYWGLANGQVKYGGTWDDRNKRKVIGSDGKELRPGEWEWFGWKMPHWMNVLVDHTPEFMTMRFAANQYQIHKLDKGEGGELKDAVDADFQEVMNSLPFMTMAGLFKDPSQTLIDRFTRVPILQSVEGMFDKQSGYKDDQTESRREHRTPLQKILYNLGGDFLNPAITGEGFKTATSIRRNADRAINLLQKQGRNDEAERIKKLRDEEIKKLYK